MAVTYENPDVVSDIAFEEVKPRSHRKLNQRENERSSVLDALTVGPRSSGIFHHTGQVADTEELVINGVRIYFEDGTPDPTADISIVVTAHGSIADDLDAIVAAVAAYDDRNFDVFKLDNDKGLGVWLADTPDNTVALDATGAANVASEATLYGGLERKGLEWSAFKDLSATDAAALADGEEALLAVFPYQGVHMRLTNVNAFVTATGAVEPLLATMLFELRQIAIDGTDRYWGLFVTDSVPTLNATHTVGFTVVGV